MNAHVRIGDAEPAPLYAVPSPFSPPTELIAAVTVITLSPAGRTVTREQRDRVRRAIDAMPDSGLQSAWYHLVDIARRYLRDYDDAPLAPRFSFQPFIAAAVAAGLPRHLDAWWTK